MKKSMSKVICLSIFATILNISPKAYADERLLFSVDIVRHGDRNPSNDIPTSPQK